MANTRIPTWDILNAFRVEQHNAYQSRIPIATQNNFKEVNKLIARYYPERNAILQSVINKVGLQVWNDLAWENPLAEFKKATVRYGDAVEEVQLGLIRATAYEINRESGEREIFGRKYIENSASYHMHNRADKYPITVDDQGGEIDRAFTTEMGVSNYISNLFAAQQNSAEWDEFQLMCQLINDYDNNDGFWKKKVSAVSDKATAQELLEAVQAMTANMRFFDRRFNAAKMNTFMKVQDAIFITTATVAAKLNVQAYADLFNMSRAEIQSRIVVIPDGIIKIPGFQGLLTTVNFFQVYDQMNKITSQENAADLYTNYWLHIRQIISYSRFVPAVVFWTGDDSDQDDIVYTPTDVSNLTFTDLSTGEAATKLTRGHVYEIAGEATVTVTPTGSEIRDYAKGVGFSLTGDQRSPRTVQRNSYLTVGFDETAPKLTLNVFSTLDPEVRKEQVIELDGDAVIEWPPQIIPAADLVEPDPEPTP